MNNSHTRCLINFYEFFAGDCVAGHALLKLNIIRDKSLETFIDVILIFTFFQVWYRKWWEAPLRLYKGMECTASAYFYVNKLARALCNNMSPCFFNLTRINFALSLLEFIDNFPTICWLFLLVKL